MTELLRERQSVSTLTFTCFDMKMTAEKIVIHASLSFLGDSNVIWKESNRIITAGKIIIRKDRRLHLQDGFNLRIDDLKEEDSGEYVCEIETFGSPIHQTSKLEILGNLSIFVFKLHSLLCSFWLEIFELLI